MSLTARTRRRAVAALGVLLLGVTPACTATGDDPEQLADWHAIALPEGMSGSTLLLTGASLLIGGSVPDGNERRPALARLPLDGTDAAPSPVPLTPTTPYGKVADLVALTGTEDSVAALGAAHGGAHANFRWTIWTGSTARVTDRPQTFETFGGWEAGTLLGLATDAQGPLVVGTWQGASGADGAVWRPEGRRWVRQPTDPAFTNTPRRQVGPRRLDQGGDDSVLVSGAVIDLTDGVHQGAAYWRGQSGSWTATTLADPGARSEAWSTACTDSCSSVGARDGSLAVWSAAGREETPELAVDDQDSARILLSGDRTIVAVSAGGVGRLLVGHRGRWRSYTAPDGRLQAAAIQGSRLLLLTADGSGRGGLWVRDVADLLRR